MHNTFIAIVMLAIAVAFVAAAATKRRSAGSIATKPRHVLTKNEQGMYWRLRETFPDHVVLAQVAFSALITSAREHRNRYSQKVADFVLLDRAMEVIAVIELDDASHKGREAQDAARSALIESAGIHVIRFKRTPDQADLRDAIAGATTQPAGNTRQL